MKKANTKKNIHKKSLIKYISEFEFWKKIALQQQMLIHAKNRT